MLSIPPKTSPSDKAIGALLVCHVAFLCVLKLSRGLEGEMLWGSHVSLAIAGLAFLIRSERLLGIVFVLTAGLHGIWLVDAVCGLAFGWFPLGLTRYLLTADALTLIGTTHHLYLTPLAAWRLRSRPTPALPALAAASALLLVITLLARELAPPVLNVNLCQAVLPRSDAAPMVLYNSFSAPAFLAIHWAFTTVVFLAPGAFAMTLLGPRVARRRSSSLPGLGVPARAFTLIELIAVIVVLAILSAVAIPKFINYSSNAATSADLASIAGINSALNEAYLQHRLAGTPAGSWITAVTDIQDAMHTDALPAGITISGAQLRDQRNNLYDFTAETATAPARVRMHVSGGGS